MTKPSTAKFHLPGLFEFYELYSRFLPLFYEKREWFYPWAEIESIYGAPAGSLWGGGRTGFGDCDVNECLKLLAECGISARLTFSNSLLKEEHLSDYSCNNLCRKLAEKPALRGGVIVHSDMLAEYLRKNYPQLYLVSSTTKVQTDLKDFKTELERPEFEYVVPDFRCNKAFGFLESLPQSEKDKVEFLCNECCSIACKDRRACYENVSRKALGEDCPDHVCRAPGAEEGYKFSKAMQNPAFIGVTDITDTYMPMGFSNFKIEGRSLGSAVVFEMLLYYLAKPEHFVELREALYLDSSLDLF